MKQFLFIIVFLFNSNSENNFAKIFGDDYQDAIMYFKTNKNIISKGLEQFDTPNSLIIPVLFPERIRYSLIRDLIETVSVEMIYVDFGSEYVDFSIGDFQLKPSFAENVEKNIRESTVLNTKYSKFLIYKNQEVKGKRKMRVKRLKSLNYQLIYISAFYDIVSLKFNLNDKSKKEKIRFLSTCYNYGFTTTKLNIEKHIRDEYFPYGKIYKGKQYAYSEVSLYFYTNDYALRTK
ncbi:MAG: hypothetical protein DRJ10_09720 [Bacteroidetes bacterium]|nr:MAG: hypothetical protein DRJ10_09720 [Bacteroidota bacterium]